MRAKVDSEVQAEKAPLLPFQAAELDRFGIRVRPSEFARLMEVSAQCVSTWIKDGKLVLGADGRLDPRNSVARLLRLTEPGRLRTRVLRPIADELDALRREVSEAKARAARAEEERELSRQTAEEEKAELHAEVETLRESDEQAMRWADAFRAAVLDRLDELAALPLAEREQRIIEIDNAAWEDAANPPLTDAEAKAALRLAAAAVKVR